MPCAAGAGDWAALWIDATHSKTTARCKVACGRVATAMTLMAPPPLCTGTAMAGSFGAAAAVLWIRALFRIRRVSEGHCTGSSSSHQEGGVGLHPAPHASALHRFPRRHGHTDRAEYADRAWPLTPLAG